MKRLALLTALLLATPTMADTLHVVDGDTLRLVRDDGAIEDIRVENIDTPEMTRPGCPAERERGILAAAAAIQLLRSAGEVDIHRIKLATATAAPLRGKEPPNWAAPQKYTMKGRTHER